MIELNLIDGEFNREELKELLMNILMSKINFHEKKTLTSLITVGNEDEISNKRVKELKSEVIKFKEFVNNMNVEKVKLKVTSTIKIEII